MHLPRTQTILIDSHPPYIIQRPYSWQLSEDEGWHVGRSHAMICPVCLRIWCKMPMEGEKSFTLHTAPCASHPTTPYEVAGSIIPASWTRWPGSGDAGLLDNLPLPLWEREFHLHLKHYERYFQ